ncbi:hypothetical protein [Micromonospora rubida]
MPTRPFALLPSPQHQYEAALGQHERTAGKGPRAAHVAQGAAEQRSRYRYHQQVGDDASAQYLISRWVDLAHRLILRGRLLLSVATDSSGFYDQPHLVRRFNRILGVGPAAFARETGAALAASRPMTSYVGRTLPA